MENNNETWPIGPSGEIKETSYEDDHKSSEYLNFLSSQSIHHAQNILFRDTYPIFLATFLGFFFLIVFFDTRS